MGRECNFCGCTSMRDTNGRKAAVCSKCHSFERHRLVKYTLESLGWLTPSAPLQRRVFHPAPERCLSELLSRIFGVGYISADLSPQNFPGSLCLKLEMPDGFDVFPDEYFDLIVHNHWLEHIPGDYHAHIAQLHRILKKGGQMVFTAPFYRNISKTRQGGEYLKTDQERLAAFGQGDHYKTFGLDFLDIFKWLQCDLDIMEIPRSVREKLGGNDEVFVYTRL